MSKLFSPFQLGPMALPHRVVMAPLTRNRAPGAIPTPLMATYYAQRSKPETGAALIITEATAISHQGQGYADVPGIWSEAQVEAWKPVTEAIHQQGGHAFMQLWHVGRISHTSLQPGGQAPVAPSALRANSKVLVIDNGTANFVDTSTPRALELSELPGIVADYRRAARNAIAAGMDGVEVHGANGYLLDQFMRRGSNQRTDAYGGSIENRARLLIEVLTAVCEEIGGARVGVRLSPVSAANDAADDLPQPLFNHVVRALGPLGLSYVHVVEGQTGGARDFNQGSEPFSFDALRDAYRSAGGQGAWMVNNAYTRELAEQSLEHGADLVAFGRPFISNPDLTARLRVNAAWTEGNRRRYYAGGAEGYTDYPALA